MEQGELTIRQKLALNKPSGNEEKLIFLKKIPELSQKQDKIKPQTLFGWRLQG